MSNLIFTELNHITDFEMNILNGILSNLLESRDYNDRVVMNASDDVKDIIGMHRNCHKWDILLTDNMTIEAAQVILSSAIEQDGRISDKVRKAFIASSISVDIDEPWRWKVRAPSIYHVSYHMIN